MPRWLVARATQRSGCGSGPSCRCLLVVDHITLSFDRRQRLQASQLSQAIRGKGELAVVGGPVTRQAVRLRILFRTGPAIDLVPLDAGPQFPVKFYAVFYLQPPETAWMPERVVAYDQAGRKIAECWATTGEGNVCDRPADAPQPP